MYDVIVVGSGAAGMTAALCTAQHGLRTLVVEKAEHFGGSTARSGGGIWVPNNAVLAANGVTDSPEQASAYLGYQLTPTLAVRVGTGRVQALRGPLASTVVDVSLVSTYGVSAGS